MRLVPRSVLLAACVLVITSASFASVITFSNLPGKGTAVPNGYAGLNWNNFYDMNAALTPSPSWGGGVPAFTSFAYNNAGAVASFGSNGTFNFTSAWLGTEWANRMGLEVLGLLDGKIVDRKILLLSNGAPQQVTFDWTGIDQVRFSPLGTASSKGTLQFAISELIVNPSTPEPSTLFLLAPGLGLSIARLRKMRPGK